MWSPMKTQKARRCLVCFEAIGATGPEYHTGCCKKLFLAATPPTLAYSLADVKKMAKEVVNRRLAIPGVQPKLSLTYENPKTHDRLTIVGLWEGSYVLKPPNPDYPELPEIEALTMLMARECGIAVAKHGLIRFRSGELAYITRRFDRQVKGRNRVIKLAQEDLCQVTGLLTENKYKSSMEKVARAVLDHSTNKVLEALVLFEVTAFSFLVGNSDMHLKNFSLLTKEDGDVRLSPAYDLVASKLVQPGDKEDTALTIGGKKIKLTRDDLLRFAESSQIPRKAAENVFTRFAKKIPALKRKIELSFLSPKMQREFSLLIDQRAKRLGL